MVDIGDTVRHRTAGWQGTVTRHLDDDRVEVWENQSLAPYATPHSVPAADLEVIAAAPADLVDLVRDAMQLPHVRGYDDDTPVRDIPIPLERSAEPHAPVKSRGDGPPPPRILLASAGVGVPPADAGTFAAAVADAADQLGYLDIVVEADQVSARRPAPAACPCTPPDES